MPMMPINSFEIGAYNKGYNSITDRPEPCPYKIGEPGYVAYYMGRRQAIYDITCIVVMRKPIANDN
jgi:hypothetical protein